MKITSDGIVPEGSDKITAWEQLAPGGYTTIQSAGPLTVAYVRENGASAIKESVKNALLAAELKGRTLEAIYVDTDRGLTPVSQRPGGAALLEDIRANRFIG